MKEIDILTLRLEANQIAPRDIPKLRGYIAKQFPEYIELHNHTEKDKVKYGYPMIQYKSVNSTPVIIGINEAASILYEVFYSLKEINLDNVLMDVPEKGVIVKKKRLGVLISYARYKFLSPWMALNQENYKTYLKADEQGKNGLLKKILIGNLLSMSKSFQYRLENRIDVMLNVEPKKVMFKNNEMIAFTGEFITNYEIPDWLGIGKSVSRGFGTVEKIEGQFY